MSFSPISLFQNLADHMPVGISIFELISRKDMDFKYVYANKKLDEIHGVAQQSLIGMNSRSLFAPAYEGTASFPSAMMKVLDTQQETPMGVQTYVDERFGPRVVEVTCFYLQENHVAFLTKTSNEVASLTQELSIQKQMLEQGEKTGGLCTWIINGETEEISFTQSYQDIYHVQGEEINAKNATKKRMSRIHPTDREKIQRFITANHETFPVSASYRYMANEDHYVWLQDTLSQRLPDGRLMGITQDITESHKKEQQLQELNEELAAVNEELRVSNEELFEGIAIRERLNTDLEKALHFQEIILQNSPEAIFIYDLEQKKNIFSSQSVLDISGYSQEEIYQMGDQVLEKIIHPDDLEEVQHNYSHILPKLKPGERKSSIRRIIRKDKKIIWQKIIQSVFERNEKGQAKTIIGTTMDISREKQAEERTLAANKELEQFVYSVSHDLRAPVRHIEGYAEQIKEESANLTEDGQTRLEKVIYSAKRLGNMIDQLLAYSRSRNAQPDKSWIDSKKLLSEILIEFKQSHSQQIINWEMQELPFCYGDPGMVRQIWENLISNAIKYSSKKDETHIRILAEEKEAEIIFSIHDNGAGFDSTYADKLFAVFQRLHKKREFPGNGIGLANVARMLQHHEGRIWGESVKGEGASFYFSIPTQKQEEMTQKNPIGK